MRYMQQIIGNLMKALFQEKNMFKQKPKLIQLKDLTLQLGIIWQDLEENQNVTRNQLKWLIIL